MAAILEMPQYVAYKKNVFIKLSEKSHSFNILRTMDGLSCPTNKGTRLKAPKCVHCLFLFALVLRKMQLSHAKLSFSCSLDNFPMKKI